MTPGEALFSAPDVPTALAELCRRFHVQKLEVFGSAATGVGFEAGKSDLDLLVVFEPLEPGDYARSYFGLHKALEVLSGRPVDLLTEPALKNPYLRQRINDERRRLFPAA